MRKRLTQLTASASASLIVTIPYGLNVFTKDCEIQNMEGWIWPISHLNEKDIKKSLQWHWKENHELQSAPLGDPVRLYV